MICVPHHNMLDLSVSPGWLDQWQLPKAPESHLRGPQHEDQSQLTPSEFPDKPVDPTKNAGVSKLTSEELVGLTVIL